MKVVMSILGVRPHISVKVCPKCGVQLLGLSELRVHAAIHRN